MVSAVAWLSITQPGAIFIGYSVAIMAHTASNGTYFHRSEPLWRNFKLSLLLKHLAPLDP